MTRKGGVVVARVRLGVCLIIGFTRRLCPSYRLQWWSCPGLTQWERLFSKEGLSELALVGGSHNPWVRRCVAALIDTNERLVSLPLCAMMSKCVVQAAQTTQTRLIPH